MLLQQGAHACVRFCLPGSVCIQSCVMSTCLESGCALPSICMVLYLYVWLSVSTSTCLSASLYLPVALHIITPPSFSQALEAQPVFPEAEYNLNRLVSPFLCAIHRDCHAKHSTWLINVFLNFLTL